MNECYFTGRFVFDPELRKVPRDGKAETSVVNFRLAVERNFTKTDGEKSKQVNMLDFEVWDSAAEVIAKYFKKGDSIIIRASARNEVYIDEVTGKKINRVRFRVERFEFPGARVVDNEE